MLSEETYMEYFPHTVWPPRVLALFTIRKKNSPHPIEKGFKCNHPGGDHAEIRALEEIQNHIPLNNENYVVTLFVSYSPCLSCCKEILDFLKQRNRVQFEIQASKIFTDTEGLRLLNEAGVPIKIMRRADYEESFQLFVRPGHSFKPWNDLDARSQQQAGKLNRILQQ